MRPPPWDLLVPRYRAHPRRASLAPRPRGIRTPGRASRDARVERRPRSSWMRTWMMARRAVGARGTRDGFAGTVQDGPRFDRWAAGRVGGKTKMNSELPRAVAATGAPAGASPTGRGERPAAAPLHAHRAPSSGELKVRTFQSPRPRSRALGLRVATSLPRAARSRRSPSRRPPLVAIFVFRARVRHGRRGRPRRRALAETRSAQARVSPVRTRAKRARVAATSATARAPSPRALALPLQPSKSGHLSSRVSWGARFSTAAPRREDDPRARRPARPSSSAREREARDAFLHRLLLH